MAKETKKLDEVSASEPILKLKLRRAVLVDGESSETLEFREPTAKDVMTHGMPVNVVFTNDVPRVEFETQKMAAMIGELAGIPPSSVEKLHPKDFTTIAWQIAGFFVPDQVT